MYRVGHESPGIRHGMSYIYIQNSVLYGCYIYTCVPYILTIVLVNYSFNFNLLWKVYYEYDVTNHCITVTSNKSYYCGIYIFQYILDLNLCGLTILQTGLLGYP